MTALDLAMKLCRKCGKSKPLSDFWRNKNTSDGHHVWCKTCARPGIDAANARRRQRLGEEEWHRLNRESVAKARLLGTADVRPNQARTAAYLELGRRHAVELTALVRIERQKLGLNPDSQRKLAQ